MSESKPFIFEVCANSVESARHAQEGGAHRVELCQNLKVGGVTPSWELVRSVRDLLHIPIHVLIREREGDFVYNEEEFSKMLADIQTCHGLGLQGIVIGLLDRQGQIDVSRMRQVMEAANPMSVTFHRAFDEIIDKVSALDIIVSLGCSRILTAGCASGTVHENASELAKLVTLAKDRIVIMPGGGLQCDGLPELVRISGATEFHGSARQTESATQHRTRSGEEDQTDLQMVKDIVCQLQDLTSELC